MHGDITNKDMSFIIPKKTMKAHIGESTWSKVKQLLITTHFKVPCNSFFWFSRCRHVKRSLAMVVDVRESVLV